MHIDDLTRLFHAHAQLATFLIVFAKRMGLPVPVLPFLLLAGARGADDGVFAFAILALATVASVLADGLWFAAGRRFGRGILGLVCRISISPDSCIRRSEVAFAERAAVTVVVARFIPGVGPLAPPLAGALGMRAGSFMVLNLAGAATWTGCALAAGMVLHEQVARVVARLQELGSRALPVLLLALAAWLGWLALRRFLITFAARQAPRIGPRELADRMARGDALLVLDVRGGVAVGARIPGAVPAGRDDEVLDGIAKLPAGVDLVAYCDCPNDVSAARLAARLRKRGLPVRVLAGGFGAWVAAGLPVQAQAQARAG